jgi:membrane protein YqaA with SNARE-associated domain
MTLWLQTATRAAGAAGRRASSNRSPLLRWLVSLGGLGLFGVAIIDSSVIPLPLPGSTDLLLLLLTAHRRTTVVLAVWLAFCAFAGSMIGGYLTWEAGRKGGQAALAKYVPKRFLGRITGWIEKHGVWSVGVSAILPPPVPLTPFLLAAGALGMTRGRFLASYGTARAIRYGLLAWLGVTYGRRIVNLWRHKLNAWSSAILWTYVAIVVLGIGFSLWKFYRTRRSGGRIQTPAEDIA